MSNSVAFCWADKAMLRRIRERVPDVASALSVYFALCEIASDNASDEFIATQTAIALKSGLSCKSIHRRIADLESIQAITVDAPALKGPARFKLLHTIGHSVRAIGHGVRTFGHAEVAPSPISNVQKKQEITSSEEEEGTSSRPLDDEGFLNSLELNPKYQGIDIRALQQKMFAWCKKNQATPSRKRLIEWLKKEVAARPMQPIPKQTPRTTF